MKHLKIIGLALVIMVMVIPAAARAEGLGNARLSLVEGDVQIRSEDSSDWLPVSVNMPLQDGDSIWVPDGARAEIQLAGGTQVRLDERSSLDLLNISRDSSQFYLAEGSAYVNSRGGRSGGLLQFDTPVSSVRVYDRSAFNVDVAGNGDTDVSVYKGLVHAESADGSTRVTEGNTLEISDDYADLAPLGRADAWERWNTDRDRRFEESRYSSRYLPDELDTYASEFDNNGRWVNVGGYGNVWTPTVQVSVGWSPYRNGRWCWIRGDYVWVGYEPWGWAPYHYGRWDYSSSIGWFWIPPARGSVYWGPGYVGWVRTPTYVAWVPLAPRETYYGYGNYGPDSVNIINVNINTIVVKNRYKNAYVRDGFTVQHNDTFVRGRHQDFRVSENPFLREKIHIGRPDIKPERESRMAVIRDIPRAKEPPKKIKEVRVREIRESRPMVTERDRSVFSPEKPRKQMRIESVEAPRERKSLEERSKDRDKKGKKSERPQIQEKSREIAPKGSDDKNGRQQDKQGPMRKEKESVPGNTAPVVQPPDRTKPRQIEQQDPSVLPKREVQPTPERTKKREVRPTDESLQEQPKVNRRDREPVQDRQIQREQRPPVQQERQPVKQDVKQEKKQEKQKDKEEKKEKGKKKQEEKDGTKPPAGTVQQPVVR